MDVGEDCRGRCEADVLQDLAMGGREEARVLSRGRITGAVRAAGQDRLGKAPGVRK